MKRACIVLISFFITLTGTSQQKITLTNGCNYTGATGETEITASESSEDARAAVERIMKLTGLIQNFTIMAADVPNAAAITYESKRFILYNQSFIQKISNYNNNDWPAIGILTHDMGHQLAGHNLDNSGNRPSKELEADLFSGFVLYKMGASLDDATKAVQIMSEAGTATYPGRTARIAAITKGWMLSKGLGTQADTEIQQPAVTPNFMNASKKELAQKYAGYAQQGAIAFKRNNFKEALENFKNSLQVYDLMQTKGYVSPSLFDSTTTVYAGISAEKAYDAATAAWYYEKIANRKCNAKGFVEIYKWLADHYKQTGNLLRSMKYLALGREVYPNDPFWAGFELDITRDNAKKNELLNKYEQTISENSNNPLELFKYGVELYWAGYAPDVSRRPGNSSTFIAKAIEVLNKVQAIKPDFASAPMVLGQIYYNQGVDINDINKAIKPEDGGKLTEEQINKKDQLREQMMNKLNQAQPYLAKVVSLLDGQKNLATEDKGNFKKALDLLIVITNEKIKLLENKKQLNSSLDITAEMSTLKADLANYNQLFNSINPRR